MFYCALHAVQGEVDTLHVAVLNLRGARVEME